MAGLRYIGLSLCLGVITVWASEMMFWIVPPSALGALDLLMTWGAYSLAAAAALSAVILTKAGGLKAAFLGGAMLGYLVEGVIVGTIYESFPLQLVWTPLAWHGLLTGAVVIGLARAPRSPLAQAGFWLAVGLGASVWALYWPFERPVLPDTPTLLVYLAAPAVLVALSHWMIDHLAPVPRPPAWLLWLSPVVLAGLWLVQTVVTLDPLRLSIIPVLALVIVAMRGAGAYQAWGAPRPLWQHGLVLIAPVTVACLAPWLWATFGAQEVNVPIALGSGLVSLGWFAWLFVGGVRRPTPVLTGARS